MKFNDYPTLYSNYSGKWSEPEYYYHISQSLDNPISLAGLIGEHFWYDSGRPYYNLYPSLIKSFAKLKLDLPLDRENIRIPHGLCSLCIRLSEGNETILMADGHYLKSILISTVKNINGDGLILAMDYGETAEDIELDKEFKITEHAVIRYGDYETVEKALNDYFIEPAQLGPSTVTASMEGVKNAFRIALACTLLEKNNDILEPEVLNRDLEKARTASPEELERLVARARNNHKFGWSVGRKIEVDPHWRNPHQCWQAVGKKWSQRRLIIRAGSHIHKDKIKEVPTGYLDDEMRTTDIGQ